MLHRSTKNSASQKKNAASQNKKMLHRGVKYSASQHEKFCIAESSCCIAAQFLDF